VEPCLSLEGFEQEYDPGMHLGGRDRLAFAQMHVVKLDCRSPLRRKTREVERKERGG